MAHLIQGIRRGNCLTTFYRSSCNTTKNAQESIVTMYDKSLEKYVNDLGFSEKTKKVIADYSKLTPCNDRSVNLVLETLKKLQFGSDLVVKLIEAHPLLLLSDPRTLGTTCTNLLELFSKNYVYKILLKSPEVLNEKWDITSSKLKYLQEEMCVSNLDIINNGVLKHPLHYIKLRHELLKRAGRYKTVNPKLTSFEKHKLIPSIDSVLNTTTADFSTKVARISELEFEIFQELYSEQDI